MRKILLVENRLKRQEDYLDTKDLDSLKAIPNLIRMSENELSQLRELKGKQALILEFLFRQSPSIVMIHESFARQDLECLQQLLKQKDKNLIIFSGGISQSLYNKNKDGDNSGAVLYINAKDFYSPRLIDFVNKYCKEEIAADNLLYLLYGEKYNLPGLLDLRNALWQNNYSVESNSIKKYVEIINLIDIEAVKKHSEVLDDLRTTTTYIERHREEILNVYRPYLVDISKEDGISEKRDQKPSIVFNQSLTDDNIGIQNVDDKKSLKLDDMTVRRAVLEALKEEITKQIDKIYQAS